MPSLLQNQSPNTDTKTSIDTSNGTGTASTHTSAHASRSTLPKKRNAGGEAKLGVGEVSNPVILGSDKNGAAVAVLDTTADVDANAGVNVNVNSVGLGKKQDPMEQQEEVVLQEDDEEGEEMTNSNISIEGGYSHRNVNEQENSVAKYKQYTCDNYQGFLRTSEKISGERLKSTNHELPPGMPIGPWRTIDDMKRALDTWSQSLDFGGYFKLNIKDFGEGIRSRGPQMRYCCAHHRLYKSKGVGKRRRSSMKTGCKFGIKCELSTEGWVLMKMSDEAYREVSPFKPHNHPLKQILDDSYVQSNSQEKVAIPNGASTEIDERNERARREVELQAICLPMCKSACTNDSDSDFLKNQFQHVYLALTRRQALQREEAGKSGNANGSKDDNGHTNDAKQSDDFQQKFTTKEVEM